MFPLRPLLLSLLPLYGAVAQFVPPPTGQEELRNPANPNVVVRYKSPGQDICQTKNPDQKQYAGYVQLPPDTLKAVQQDYPMNTFFWFVEARENPHEAPLTIWLNGGPGSSSLLGMLAEVGPCQVVPFNDQSIGTVPREYGWDGLSNMLFFDQPNQVGYSYDTVNNGSLPLLDPNAHYFPGKVAPPLSQQPLVSQINVANDTAEGYLEALWSTLLINGTFPSGNISHMANTTEIAAISAWHFLQPWLQNFPQYNPKSNGVNLFAESYGGKYGPTFFAYFEEQNQKRKDGELSVDETVEIHIESLGIVNGCIDVLIQQPSYPIYANSNPYGVKVISDEVRDSLLQSFYKKGGCEDQIKQCRALQETYDVHDFGGNSTVNAVCAAANENCDAIRSVYRNSSLSFYDITAPVSEAFPPMWNMEWLSNATVQEAVGSPVNFTESDYYVFNAFAETGDFVRGGQVADIAYLLDSGVRVALVYGDRDYICNYMGGESVSLAVPYESHEAFNLAGYENITLDDNSVAGQVRQHGNFSFSRVYQAGHLVPAYQPHAAFSIFERIVTGKAISTGSDIVVQGDDIYSTEGPQNTTQTLKAPPPPAPTCFIRDISTCDEEQWNLISERKAVIVNGVVVNGKNSTRKNIMAPDDVFAGPGAKFGDGPGKKSESEEKEGYDTEGPGDAQNDGDVSDAAGRHIMVLDTVVVMLVGVVALGAAMLL